MIMLASKNQEARKIKVKRENVYYITTFVVFIGLCAATMALPQHLTGDRGSTLLDNLVFYILCFGHLAMKAGTMACRRLGVSLDGQKIEKIKRANGANTAIYVEKPLVIRRQGAQFIFPVCMTLLATICFWPFQCNFVSLQQAAFHIFIFSTVVAIGFFSWLNVRKPLVSLDSQGIVYCELLGLQTNVAKWEAIESCEVVRVLNVFGKEIQHFIVVNKVGGKKFKMYISNSSPEINAQNTERVTDFLRSAFNDKANRNVSDEPGYLAHRLRSGFAFISTFLAPLQLFGQYRLRCARGK